MNQTNLDPVMSRKKWESQKRYLRTTESSSIVVGRWKFNPSWFKAQSNSAITLALPRKRYRRIILAWLQSTKYKFPWYPPDLSSPIFGCLIEIHEIKRVAQFSTDSIFVIHETFWFGQHPRTDNAVKRKRALSTRSESHCGSKQRKNRPNALRKATTRPSTPVSVWWKTQRRRCGNGHPRPAEGRARRAEMSHQPAPSFHNRTWNNGAGFHV